LDGRGLTQTCASDHAALNEPDEHHHHYAAFDAALSALPPEES
jgi:hypothetical protein